MEEPFISVVNSGNRIVSAETHWVKGKCTLVAKTVSCILVTAQLNVLKIEHICIWLLLSWHACTVLHIQCTLHMFSTMYLEVKRRINPLGDNSHSHSNVGFCCFSFLAIPHVIWCFTATAIKITWFTNLHNGQLFIPQGLLWDQTEDVVQAHQKIFTLTKREEKRVSH